MKEQLCAIQTRIFSKSFWQDKLPKNGTAD